MSAGVVLRRAAIAGAICSTSVSCGFASPAAIEVQPGESIQSAVDRHPIGHEIRIRAGVHVGQSIRPKPGNRFVGDLGAVLDGAGAAEFAFYGTTAIDSVLIEGLEIRNYAPPPQWAAIRGVDTVGWIVRGNDIHDNTGGVRVGHAMQLVGNHIHHNHQTGVMGQSHGLLIEGNEIASNNHDLAFHHRDYPETYEAGGMKLTFSRDVVIRNNVIRNNGLAGIWIDLDCERVTIESNVIEGNIGQGIYYEISRSGTIRDNLIIGNGLEGSWYHHGGIIVASSSGVRVTGNDIVDNGMGVIGSAIERGSGDLGRRTLTDLVVERNRFHQPAGLTGIVRDDSVGDAVFDDPSIRFLGNTYTLGPANDHFRWRQGDRTAEEWRDAGHDALGTFDYLRIAR